MNVEWWSRHKKADNINKTVVVRYLPTWHEPTELDDMDFMESMLYTSHIQGRGYIAYRLEGLTVFHDL